MTDPVPSTEKLDVIARVKQISPGDPWAKFRRGRNTTYWPRPCAVQTPPYDGLPCIFVGADGSPYGGKIRYWDMGRMSVESEPGALAMGSKMGHFVVTHIQEQPASAIYGLERPTAPNVDLKADEAAYMEREDLRAFSEWRKANDMPLLYGRQAEDE